MDRVGELAGGNGKDWQNQPRARLRGVVVSAHRIEVALYFLAELLLGDFFNVSRQIGFCECDLRDNPRGGENFFGFGGAEEADLENGTKRANANPLLQDESSALWHFLFIQR